MVFIGRRSVNAKLKVDEELCSHVSTPETRQRGCYLLHNQRLKLSLCKRQTECKQITNVVLLLNY